MEVCRQYQVPYSKFKEWLPEDQAKALVYEQYLKARCPKCGTRREDFLEEDEEGNAKPLEEPLWYAVHKQCPGCEEFEQVDKALKEEQRRRGMFTTFIPAEDLDEDSDEVFDQAPNVQEMKLPGLE